MEWIKEVFHPVQIIGYMGMACAFISYQCKRNKLYFIFQTLCSVCFTTQFLLLGSLSGAFMNIINVARGLTLSLPPHYRKPILLVLLEVAYVTFALVSVLVMGEVWWIALLLLLAEGCAMMAMWSRNGRLIRFNQLLLSSPSWIINNIYYFSIGGILCESFNIISVIVSLIRFRHVKLDQD